MEFLHPKIEDEDNKMILLVLVSKDRNTYAVCYEWETSETLREKPPKIIKRQLPAEYRLPSMVIPSIKPSSFLVVSATSMAVYDNILKQASRHPMPVFEEEENQRTPLWVQWARPKNREYLYKQFHDDIFLCRHDGKVVHVAIDNIKGDIEFQTYLGSVGCDVDAFDVLDSNAEGFDLILAAGIMGDGGLFMQKSARDPPQCVQRLLNWAPIMDSVFVGERLFACSGTSPGSLVEFRYGIEAQIGLFAAQEELSHARDMWAMPETTNGGTYILTSDPESSLLIYITRDCDEIDAVGGDSGLDLATQTLAAAMCIQTGAIAQVTNKAIHIGGTNIPFDGNAICAAIDRSGSLILAAVRPSHPELFLCLASVPDASIVHAPVMKIDYEPVCLSIEDSLAFVGTTDGRVVIYNIHEKVMMFLACYSVGIANDDDMSTAVESIVLIGSSRLFCGLRNGFLVPFDVSLDGQSIGMCCS